MQTTHNSRASKEDRATIVVAVDDKELHNQGQRHAIDSRYTEERRAKIRHVTLRHSLLSRVNGLAGPQLRRYTCRSNITALT